MSALSPTLKLDNVQISLKGEILLSIDAEIAPGEVLTIMGASGSGKSSLLAFVAGFLDPVFQVSGRICLGATDLAEIEPEDRHIGLLFQDPLLFPHFSVGGNVQFAIPERIKGKESRRKIAEKALAAVDLNGFYDRHPDSLSGGQKARVALQRVLVSEPAALLLDEPFSKLDANLRQQTRAMVFEQARLAKIPVLLVTHDEADAAAAGGNIIHLSGKGG